MRADASPRGSPIGDLGADRFHERPSRHSARRSTHMPGLDFARLCDATTHLSRCQWPKPAEGQLPGHLREHRTDVARDTNPHHPPSLPRTGTRNASGSVWFRMFLYAVRQHVWGRQGFQLSVRIMHARYAERPTKALYATTFEQVGGQSPCTREGQVVASH